MAFQKKKGSVAEKRNTARNKDKPMAMFDDERGRYLMDGEGTRTNKKVKMFIEYEDRKE